MTSKTAWLFEGKLRSPDDKGERWERREGQGRGDSANERDGGHVGGM